MYDLIIIGSGPAGLTAAIYAERSALSVLVIEKEYEGTGQIADSGKVDNYPGLPGISGYELGERFREHAVSAGACFLEQEVVRIEASEGQRGYRVYLSDNTVQETLSLIFAGGASPRKADIRGEEKFSGKGVSYCALCDGAFYRNKTVAVLGGGDTALDDTLYLTDVADTVYLIHRRKDFRGSEKTLQLIRQRDNVRILPETQVTEILGSGKVEAIQLSNGNTLAVDGVFIAFGSIPQTEIIRNLVETDSLGYLIADENCKVYQKNSRRYLPGCFVAGDARTKHVRQVSTAIADGANAAVGAADYLHEDSGLKEEICYGI